MILSSAIAIFVALTPHPVYHAQTTLITEEIEKENLLKGVSKLYIPEKERLMQVQRLQNHTLLMKVVRKLNLRNHLSEHDYLEYKRRIGISDISQTYECFQKKLVQAYGTHPS